MANGPASNTRTVIDEIIRLKKERAKSFGLIRQAASVTLNAGVGGRGGNNQVTGGGFLLTGGDSMIGPIAFLPKATFIIDGSIDVGISTLGYSTRVIVTGEGGTDDELDTIDNPQFPGQLLYLQASLSGTITLMHDVDNIWFSDGNDFDLAPGAIIGLIWDVTVGGGGNKWVPISGTQSGAEIPEGSAENQHLEWNDASSIWEAKANMEFGTITPHADAGFLRFANDTLIISARDAGDFGNMELKLNAQNVIDWTESDEQLVKWQLRAQHATNPDAIFSIQQNPDDGTSTFDTIITFPDGELTFVRDAFPTLQINSTYSLNVFSNINMNNTQIDNPSAIVFEGFTGSGRAISEFGSGIHYDIENSAHAHVFRVDGATPNEQVRIEAQGLVMVNNIRMEANELYIDLLDRLYLEDDLGLGTFRYVNETVGGAHAWYVNSTASPKFLIAETQFESFIPLYMHENSIVFDDALNTAIAYTTDGSSFFNLNYVVDEAANGAHLFFVDSLITPKFEIGENLIQSNIPISMKDQNIVAIKALKFGGLLDLTMTTESGIQENDVGKILQYNIFGTTGVHGWYINGELVSSLTRVAANEGLLRADFVAASQAFVVDEVVDFATFVNASPINSQMWWEDNEFKFREGGVTKTLGSGGGGTPDDNSVGPAQLVHLNGGSLLSYNGSGVPIELGAGVLGRRLTSNGAGNQLSWDENRFTDDQFDIHDGTTPGKKLEFQLANLTSGNNFLSFAPTSGIVSITFPGANTILAGLSIAETFSAQQTFSAQILANNSTKAIDCAGPIDMNIKDINAVRQVNMSTQGRLTSDSNGPILTSLDTNIGVTLTMNGRTDVRLENDGISGSLTIAHNFSNDWPEMRIQNEDGTFADDDIVGLLNFNAPANSVVTIYGAIQVFGDDVSAGTVDGRMELMVQSAGNQVSPNGFGMTIRGGFTTALTQISFRGATPQAVESWSRGNSTEDRSIDTSLDFTETRNHLNAIAGILSRMGIFTGI